MSGHSHFTEDLSGKVNNIDGLIKYIIYGGN